MVSVLLEASSQKEIKLQEKGIKNSAKPALISGLAKDLDREIFF
jgi:hypothetical protein